MPDTRNYYVFCDDNCRFPAMTKEEVIAAIAEATGETPVHIDDAFITKIKEQNKNKNLKIWVGTEAEYNAIVTKDNDTMYIFKTTTGKILLHDALDLKNLIGNLDDLETTEKSNLVGAINENVEAIEEVDNKFTGVESRTLLWTNASPTSDFAQQTLSLDLSNYEEIEIEFKGINGGNVKITVGETCNASYTRLPSNSAPYYNGRQIVVYADRIAFSDCIEYYNNASNVINNRFIPYKIYGIKKVVA